MKRNIIIGFLLIVLVALVTGYNFNNKEESQTTTQSENIDVEKEIFEQITEPLISEEEAETIRVSTYNNCQELIDKKITFEGKVMYSECGKNCLGGCSNTGPLHCFYGIQNDNGCMVYVKNKLLYRNCYGDSSPPDKYVNKYQYGELVKITDMVSLYENCARYSGKNESEELCYYFILGDMIFN